MVNLLLVVLVLLAPISLSAESSVQENPVTKTLVWPDGTRYVGGVEDGKRAGKGTIFWQDGTRFVGQFENDMRNGPGTMILPDGTVYTGYFVDDELVDSPESTIAGADTPEQQTVDLFEQQTTAAIAPQIETPTEDEVVEEFSASEPEFLSPSQPGRQPEMGEPVAEVSEEEMMAAVAPTESTQPVAVEAPSMALTDAVKQELIDTLDLWGAAWSDQNVPQYLNTYSDAFDVPGRLTRSGWEALRRTRLSRPGYIDVAIVYEKFEMIDEELVDVYFRQTYRSDVYSDESDKVIRVRKEGLAWKIMSEKSL